MGLIVAALMLYLAAFSPGLSPVPWAVNAEIFPTQARGYRIFITHPHPFHCLVAVSARLEGIAALTLHLASFCPGRCPVPWAVNIEVFRAVGH
jgi:hypothetical protein